MRAFMAAAIVPFLLLVLWGAEAMAETNTCTTIADNAERLACYDNAIKAKPPSAPSSKQPSINNRPNAWQIVKSRDELSGKTTNHAETKASKEFAQRGEPVSASLVVYCSRLLKGDHGRLYAHVGFSRSVATGRTWGRVRIDDQPVQLIHPNSFSRGQTIEVFFPDGDHGPEDAMAPLFGSKRLRVEYDLPVAGKVILEFPTNGAKEAFSKLTCRDPEY
jgi:hypothetical protein